MENARKILDHRLGFAVKAMGAEIPSHDTRKYQNSPHLRVSLEFFDRILDYLAANRIALYRLSSEFAPFLTHPDRPQFHRQIEESRAEIEKIAQKVVDLGVRLSFHPSQYILLNSPDEDLTARSVADLDWQARLLDMFGQGREGALVLHLGGVYDDRETAIDRYCQRYERLPRHIRNHLVLENDDIRFSVADVLKAHSRTGVPVVFDFQHHHCNNPEGMSLREAMERAAATWPRSVTPKVHFSSPRTELRTVERKVNGKKTATLQPPLTTQHADYVNPFEFAYFLRETEPIAFDVMLEAKAKDLAVIRLCDEFEKRPWLLTADRRADVLTAQV
ncbi:MAG TPA: UV DNA damage repair endonuclease UvsE [Pyrinomonadaceae bacterium]|jgi:UV DNA damage endonuclease